MNVKNDGCQRIVSQRDRHKKPKAAKRRPETAMMPEQTLVIHDLALPLAECHAAPMHLAKLLQKQFHLSAQETASLTVCRRALDARRRNPQFVYSVSLRLPAKQAQRLIQSGKAQAQAAFTWQQWRLRRPPEAPPPVVVGAGPAGLFAALTLAQAGWPPILLERGKAVEPRAKDVSKLYAHGVLDEESNVCYGEGGAGTFSDGKLYTRVNDVRVRRFLGTLVALGADPHILIDARPHLGTDRLIKLLKDMRQHLQSLGVVLRYQTRVENFDIDSGQLRGLGLGQGESLQTRHCVVATGHSARDVWHALDRHAVAMEPRAFAVGFRVEHPQGLIDRLRYGDAAGDSNLPAADYRLVYNERPSGRGVYSFCMCPGGVVVTTPTRDGALCINGMSHAARSGRFANSALVVTVNPEDFSAAGYQGLFAGVDFQEACERRAFEAGGGNFVAPASRVTDVMAGKVSSALGSTSYRRGIEPADLATLYPEPVMAALRHGLRHFENKMRGFLTAEATLIGVETRTASPIRVTRDAQMQAQGASGLYPSGEGMGYGGGIASAAIDGIRVAEALLQQVGAVAEDITQS
ncbi:MAG: hypothetical protein R3C68_19385 [Myxococcota bacterium]